MPGHGRSSAPDIDYTAAYFTDTITHFLAACDLSGVVLAGESIGASIGLPLAARKNPRVARVIAINPCRHGEESSGDLTTLIRALSALATLVFRLLLRSDTAAEAPSTRRAA